MLYARLLVGQTYNAGTNYNRSLKKKPAIGNSN